MRTNTICTATVAAAALVGAALVAQPAAADAIADFYKNRNLTIVVGFSPGGGADLFGRFFARHLGKHIPGNPNIIVQNMPGAGGIKAVNHLYNVGAQDGSRTMLTSATHTLAKLLGRKNTRYDINKLKWLGTLTQDTTSCAATGKSGIKSIAELKDRELIFGATGASSSTNQHVLLLRNMLGYKIKVVTGYRGTAKVRLAMQKGEVQAVCAMWASQVQGTLAGQVARGELVPIVQMGTKPHPAFGNAPVVYDLARNDEERLMMRTVFKTTELTRPFATAPGAPDDRVAALRKGFWAAVNSPELKADAKRLKIIIDPLNWQDTVAAFKKIFDTPKDVIARVKILVGAK